MSNVIEQAIGPINAEDKALHDIFTKFFELEKEENKKDLGYMAWANMALHVALIMANVVLSTKRTTAGRNFRAICDLSFRLTGNDFWLKNSSFLMPLLIVALNSVKDNAVLREDAKTLQQFATYSMVINATELAPLEIFTGILYLVGGDEVMARLSTDMKLELAPYFID